MRCHEVLPVSAKASGLPQAIRDRLTFDDYISVIKDHEMKYFEFNALRAVNKQPAIFSCRRLGLHALNLTR